MRKNLKTWSNYLNRSIFISALLLLLMTPVQANVDDDPIYLDLQSGALMGLIHTSVGYELSSRHHAMAGVGYVPKLDHHKEMGLASIRYRYQHPAQWQIPLGKQQVTIKPFNVGVGLLYASHDDLFVQLPDQYPDGYYGPTGLRAIFNYQAIFKIDQSIEAYFDLSIMDFGLAYYIREPDFFYDNYDYLGLDGITNWGVGMRYWF